MCIFEGRVQSLRRHGSILFVTIVNEVETIQGMINYRLLVPHLTKDRFKLFCRLIERGDHICRPALLCSPA